MRLRLRSLLVAFGLDFLANVLWLLISLAVAQSYAQLFSLQSARGRLLPQQYAPDTFEAWLLLLGILVSLKMAADYRRYRLRGIIGESFLHFLRLRLFKQQLDLDIRGYEAKGAGRYLLRFSGDLSSAQSFITKGVLRFSSDLLMVALGMIAVFWLDTHLGAAAASVFLLLGLAVALVNRKVGKVEEQRRNRRSGLLAFVNERLHNIAAIKALNRTGTEAQRFEKRAERLQHLGVTYAHWSAMLEALIPLGLYGALGLALLVVWWKQAAGQPIDSARLFAAILILLSWRSILVRLFRVGLVWKKGLISLRKLARLFTYHTDFNLDKPLQNPTANYLLLEGLGCFLGGQWVLRNLDLKVFPGQAFVLMGGSGSGKTTLVKMLAGFYPPDEGRIQLGETALEGVHPKAWRRRIAFISSAFPLYGANLEEAIGHSKKPVHRAQAKALWQEWAMLFPPLRHLKLDMPIANGANQLSQCQLSLLQWMRALLSGKPVIVADEPFKGLSEEQRALLLGHVRTKYPRLMLIMFVSPNQFPDYKRRDYNNLHFKYLNSSLHGAELFPAFGSNII